MASDAIDRLQGLRSGVAVKAPARAVATSNITLSGEQTVDGVALVAGDRVLVTGQTSAVGNGVYDVALGAWTRSLDFDGVSDLTDGTMLLVLEGTSYGATMWRLDAAGVPDEDGLTFSSGVWVADGSVGTAELAALCVTTAKLAAEAVTAAKLATDAVETAKIKDANVTAAKLATDAVETAKIKDDNVTTAKLAAGAVTAAKLAADAITGQNEALTATSINETLLAVGGLLKRIKVSGLLAGLKFSSGSISNPGSTGDKATTGVGFQPRAVLVVAATSGGGSGSVGWASSSSTEVVLYFNASGPSVGVSNATDIVSVTGRGNASLVSFDADGFTLNWSSYSGAMSLGFLAIGW